MTSAAPQPTIDPLHAFVAGAFVAGTARKIPLVVTRFDVVIDGGLAIVSTERTFRNAEQESIEATITFPVPVHATLFGLEARIGERVLVAHAERRYQARETYEDALDRGKTAVLHEEVLRGVHMLSIGHVAAGAEVAVHSRFAMTLTNVNGRGHLRIPLTVGDIFGRSGLSCSDELIHDGPAQTASLAVECRDGSVTLVGGRLENGRARIALDAPIDLEVIGWAPKDLYGRAADGRRVLLRVEPNSSGDAALDVAVLVDRSGSMGEACSGLRHDLTKHQAAVLGFDAIARQVGPSDRVDLWEFDDTLGHVGSTGDGATLSVLVARLNGPGGGTEIGHALAGTIARSQASDVLLVTDGKSHALDVQTLARCGRRFCVVLVGEDSLEANVGHLAALTGGEIFVAAGADLAAVLEQAMGTLRAPHEGSGDVGEEPRRASARRAGMTITATWQEVGQAVEESASARAVAAIAASLAIPALSTEAAAALAAAEGLVTHLTSLVLVDEAAVAQGTIPATRKIPLPSPRTRSVALASSIPIATSAALRSAAPSAALARAFMRAMPLRSLAGNVGQKFVDLFIGPESAPAPAPVDLSRLRANIDWDRAPQRLQAGDLTLLDHAVGQAIRAAAKNAAAIALAKTLGLDPIVLVIGILARAQSATNRSAARIARAIFRDEGLKDVDALARELGVDIC